MQESSLKISDDGEKRSNRLDLIKANPRLLRRPGAWLMHQLAGHTAFFVDKHTRKHYAKYNYSYLGSGGMSAVLLKEDDKVVKIIRRSCKLDEESRQKYATEISKLITATKACHPEEVLHTSVNPSYTLGSLSLRYVALEQVFVKGEDAMKDPSMAHRLKIFAERSLDVMGRDGMLPDVVGGDNLLTTGDDLILVDTVPLLESDAHNPIDRYFYQINENTIRNMTRSV